MKALPLTESSEAVGQTAPQKLAPTPKLSGTALTIALLTVSILPLAGISLYATLYGRAAEKPLPVEVQLDRQLVIDESGQGGLVTDVVVIKNLSEHPIPNLTVDLNGQYFLYRDSPLGENETLVLPQAIFMTKANQRFTPGRYPITDVTVTGRLPSNARGVTEVAFGE